MEKTNKNERYDETGKAPAPEDISGGEQLPNREEDVPVPADEGLRLLRRAAKQVPPLSPGEEAALFRAVAAGDEDARRKLTEAYLRLVFSVARSFQRQRNSLPMEDLVQEGCLGLMKAVEKYDSAQGACFSSYAVFWIRQAIWRAVLYQGRSLRLPENVMQDLIRLSRAERALSDRLGRDPDEKELSRALGLPADRVRELRRLAEAPVSLDSTLAPESDSFLWEQIPAGPGADPQNLPDPEDLKCELRKALATLTPVEREVLCLRFGLDGSAPRSLTQLALRFGRSKEWVRLTEKMAIRKLRRPQCADRLRDFLR